jgi:hypothetical protein
MPEDEDEWLEPDDQMGLWENQGGSLTVRELMAALGQVGTDLPSEPVWQLLATTAATADIPVEIEFYDGTGTRTLRPMHIDVRAKGGHASAVVITVA